MILTIPKNKVKTIPQKNTIEVIYLGSGKSRHFNRYFLKVKGGEEFVELDFCGPVEKEIDYIIGWLNLNTNFVECKPSKLKANIIYNFSDVSIEVNHAIYYIKPAYSGLPPSYRNIFVKENPVEPLQLRKTLFYCNYIDNALNHEDKLQVIYNVEDGYFTLTVPFLNFKRTEKIEEQIVINKNSVFISCKTICGFNDKIDVICNKTTYKSKAIRSI